MDFNKWLNKLAKEELKDTCPTCACYQGFLTQMDLDGASDVRIDEMKVDASKMHKCNGCEVCPPGNLYAAYIKESKMEN